MQFGRPVFVAVSLLATAWAHPMGNFSVSHYARLAVHPGGADVTYVLDLAEIPTFEFMQQHNLDPASRPDAWQRAAQKQAAGWVKNLRFSAGGHPVSPQLGKVEPVVSPGAGNMPVLRVTLHLRVPAAAGLLEYEDHNFAERAGWKEISVAPINGASIERASVPIGAERSQALTAYPQDPAVAPPQELHASVEWAAPVPISSKTPPPQTAPFAPPKAAPAVAAAPQLPPTALPNPQPAPSRALAREQQAAGTVVRGDFLSELLGRKELSLAMVMTGLAVAFWLGTMHALSPGHGKTLVAAYLVGSRGTVVHAIFLGAMVTFTHTVSVFLLGLATMFLSQYFLPEKIYPILGAISGLSIVVIGAMLFYRRARLLAISDRHRQHGHYQHDHQHDYAYAHVHAHAHSHHGHSHHHGHHHHTHDYPHHSHVHDDTHDGQHEHGHVHHHGHDHAHAHRHGLVHDHGDGHVHSHVPEGKVTIASLIALGASGGLVPCPSAMVLLLSAIALGRVALGLLLLISFSAGLAVVLTGIGILVVYAKHLLPDTERTARHPAFRLVPVLSAAAIVCIGLVMTGVSLGWIHPVRLLS